MKTQYRTVRTRPEVFHALFAELDVNHSIVLFEVGNQAGWVSDMLRTLGLTFKVANTNDPAWKWANNPASGHEKEHRSDGFYFNKSSCPFVSSWLKYIKNIII